MEAMRRSLYRASMGVVFLAVGLEAQIRPTLLTQSGAVLETTEPFKWTVHVTVAGGRASGVVVSPRGYATAGHVVFDEDNLAWVPGSSLRAQVARHSNLVPTFSGVIGLNPTHRWTSYRTRVINDGTGNGSSTLDTFNLDFAVVHTAETLVADGTFARTFVDDEGGPSLARQARRKTILGYPADRGIISPANIGLMHQNAPGDYETYWWGRADDALDSEGQWIATHYFVDVVTYGGNSGGPVFIEGNDGRWLLNALLVGGAANRSTVRGIDAEAWRLVESAAAASGVHTLRRVIDLQAAVAGTAVVLGWTDRSTSEAAYRLERRAGNDFELLAELPADATAYTDFSVLPGTTYQYRVTPVEAGGNEAPPSPRVAIETPGTARGLAARVGAPHLHLRTSGDAPMVEEGDRLASGKIWSMEGSALVLEIVGPGLLRYTWSVSSEENPDYNDPSSPYYQDIYDAFFCTLNGEQVAFLTGEAGPREETLQIPAGAHTVRWEYAKDPYTDEGEDLGRLHALAWEPAAGAPFVYGSRQLEAETREASWFGRYTTTHLPWARHEGLGWLYFARAGRADALWAYHPASELGWLFIAADSFPFLYSHGRQTWLYHLASSGRSGSRALFYDYARGEWFAIP
jgi:hypothetical protein